MSLEFMDGFDHYGTGGAARTGPMLDGVYAEASSAQPEVTNPRTGARALSVQALSNRLRRVLSGAKTRVGQGAAFYFDALPTINGRMGLFDWRDAANVVHCFICVETTGAVAAYRGEVAAGGALLGTSAGTPLVSGSYQHIEAAVTFSNTNGSIEVRVNGVTVLSLTGIDTCSSANENCAQVCLAPRASSSGNQPGSIDDYFCWNSEGAENNDFLGDRRVRTLFPNGNTASAGWTAVGAASGYECIDEATPDDATSYVEAIGGTTPTSEFDFEDLPAVGAIAAIQTYFRARKTNAGAANMQASVVSGASVDAGTDRPITEAFTYYADVCELDPATGAPWTQSAVNAAKLRLARTA